MGSEMCIRDRIVFEAAIDMMSYMDIFNDNESNMLALGMLGDAPLETFIKEHPQIKSIRFCLDGDEPGREAARRLIGKYQKLGFEVTDAPPPEGFKDYNEWLVKAKKQQQSYSQCICRKNCYMSLNLSAGWLFVIGFVIVQTIYSNRLS